MAVTVFFQNMCLKAVTWCHTERGAQRKKRSKGEKSNGREKKEDGKRKRKTEIERKNLVNLSSIIDYLLIFQAHPAW